MPNIMAGNSCRRHIMKKLRHCHPTSAIDFVASRFFIMRLFRTSDIETEKLPVLFMVALCNRADHYIFEL